MEPLISPSSSQEKLQYSPRESEEQFEFNGSRHEKPKKDWNRVLICFFSLIWFIIIFLLISIYYRLGGNQKCSCSEINDVGNNLLVEDDLSIINKVARPYHYLEPKFDVDDFIAGDPVWNNLFPGKICETNAIRRELMS